MRCLLLSLLLTTTAIAQQPVSLLRARLPHEPDSVKIAICLELCKAYADNQPDSAFHYCKAGMELAEKSGNRHMQALLLLELGDINMLRHHAELARKFYNEALSAFRTLHEQEEIALAYDKLGLLDGQQQNITAATGDFNQAMQFYKDANDSLGILETYYGLGLAYEEKGDTETALTYYLRALVQYEHRSQKPESYFELLERMSHLYEQRGDNHTALHYLAEGVQNSNAPMFRDTEVTLLDEEGKIMEGRGQKAGALTYYKQALADAKKFNLPEEEAKALSYIAGVLKQQNASQSLAYLKQALRIAQDLREPQLEASIYEAMAGVYRQEKNYKEAMLALEEHHRLLDSLLGANDNKEIAELDSSYALEDSREKISSLQDANTKEDTALKMGLLLLIAIVIILLLLWFYLRKTKRLNQELKSSNQVKDTLFSIIGHDLKGPAGSAAQLFALMETETFTEADMRLMIPELRKQTNASFELLNSLLEWGKSQLQGVQAQPLTLITKPVIDKNINLLLQQAIAKNIVISDHTPAGAVIFADANHFDFIIRNLLSNAIKFTHQHGRIDVNAQVKEGYNEVIYSVTDTGIGISPAQQKAFLQTNLTVSFGTKGEKGSGLGLLLIREFIKANKGRIWLESEEGKGTTFYFTFPVAKKE